jgi:predicted NBD/HSP70 family sugar kinase
MANSGVADDRRVGRSNQRTERLSVSLSGTNLARAGDFNQRTVLQAIRLQGETTRIELARQTGLTTPTIANITSRLLRLGLVRLVERQRGSRGQPAIRLTINTDGAFAIGLNIDRDHATLLSLDLAGKVRSRISRDMSFAMPADVVAFVRDNLEQLTVEGKIDRQRILGVGVALPDDLGTIALPHLPAGYDGWDDLGLDALLADVLPWPIHVDNDAASAALGEAQCGTGVAYPNFFYLLISAGLGGGPYIDGSYYRGASLRSGEIGLMPDAASGVAGALVQDVVSISALGARLDSAGLPFSKLDDLLSDDRRVAEVVTDWVNDAACALLSPLVAINCLINPGAVLIGGRLPLTLIDRLCVALNRALGGMSLPSIAPVIPAQMLSDAPAIGAAILPFLHHLFPSDAVLIQAGRPEAPPRAGRMFA